MANVNEEVVGLEPLTPAAFQLWKEKDEWGGSRQFNVRLDQVFRIASWLKRSLDEEELGLLVYKDGPAALCVATEEKFQPYAAPQIKNDFESWPAAVGERLTAANLTLICAHWPPSHPLAGRLIRYGHHLISGREILSFSGTFWYVAPDQYTIPNPKTPLGIARRIAAEKKEIKGLMSSLPLEDAQLLLQNFQERAEERRRENERERERDKATERKIREFFGDGRRSR